MRPDEEDVGDAVARRRSPVVRVPKLGDEPVPVASDVEDDDLADEVGGAVLGLELSRVLIASSFDFLDPCNERALGVWMGSIERLKCRFLDDPHTSRPFLCP